jgi:hypothetical protein
MSDAPSSAQGPDVAEGVPAGLDRTVRFLRLLTGLLAGTMILGLIAIVALLVTRWPVPPRTAALPVGATLDGGLRLPPGLTAEAVTIGAGWALLVTEGREIVVFDPSTGAIRQRVPMTP